MAETATNKGKAAASAIARPTLRTIAEATGLAVTTVSRALKNEPEIAKATRERVRAVADELGYMPDRAALRLRTGQTNVISYVLFPHSEIIGFGTSVIAGLTEALRETQYHLIVTPHFPDMPAIQPIEYILRNRMADGIIFSRTDPFDARVRLLLENDFPFVCHGRTELATPHSFVDYDNFEFAKLATQRLIDKGRSNLMLLNAPEAFTFSNHMRHGFMTAVRQSGVSFHVPSDLSIESPPQNIREACLNELKSANPPDGFVCGGEVSAMAVMAAVDDLGLKVGKEVDIVAKQTSPLFDQIRPRIDTVYEDLMETGRLLGRTMLRRLAGDPVSELQTIDRPRTLFADSGPDKTLTA
ncbi:MAG: LacI family DNA-binding transcriptional regulator [Rhizobiaceae bacterium]